MRVSELMHTPAVTCTPRDTVSAVAQLMATRNVGSIVVIDNVGEVAGIVTDRDITIRGVAEGRSGDIPVEALMTRNVALVDPRADIADAAATMMKRRVRRLPVVDDRGHVHGLVASTTSSATLSGRPTKLAISCSLRRRSSRSGHERRTRGVKPWGCELFRGLNPSYHQVGPPPSVTCRPDRPGGRDVRSSRLRASRALAGRRSGNSRNGSYPKTVTTEIGPVELRAPPGSQRHLRPGEVSRGNAGWTA